MNVAPYQREKKNVCTNNHARVKRQIAQRALNDDFKFFEHTRIL